MSGRLRRWARRALVWATVTALIIAAVFESGLAGHWMRGAFVSRLEQATGARVEMGGFRFHFWNLRLEIDDLTLHGLEAANQPPLFHAGRVNVAVRILSFFGRKISLDELIVDRPQVAVRIDGSGHSNLPAPKSHASNRPWRQTLFDLRIGRLELRDGAAMYNDMRVPLSIDGKDVAFVLHYDAQPNGADSYAGDLGMRQVRFASKRDVPFPFDLSAKFSLHRDSFELNEIVLKALHSTLNLQAELPSFSRPGWNFKYRGRLSLSDVRSVTRQPTTPDGDVDFSGQARYAPRAAPGGAATGNEWSANGYYSSSDVAMPYRFFHDKKIETSGDFVVANRRLTVPNVSVHALGGTVDGRLDMDFKGLAFRTKTQVRGVSLAQLFDALDNDELPVRSLHWGGAMEVDSVNTWNANFKNFRTQGETRWSPPDILPAGEIPATARVEFDYRSDQQIVAVSQSEIATPTALVDFDGVLGAKDSALEVKFRSDDLAEWDDFISAIRGPDAGVHRVRGKAVWRGRVLGPLTGPAFVGHLSATGPQYDNLAWDHLDGDMEYSPDGFLLKNTVVRRGSSSTTLDLSLQFGGNWNFLPSSTWALDARVERASVDDLEVLFGASYPVTGALSGDVRGSGTRASPVVDANFVAEDIATNNLHADRLSGQLHWAHDEIRLSHAELRESFGIVAGGFVFRPEEQQVEFNLTGAAIALEKIKGLQTASLPIGGRLDFDLRGSGPLAAPVAQGNLRVANLVLGQRHRGVGAPERVVLDRSCQSQALRSIACGPNLDQHAADRYVGAEDFARDGAGGDARGGFARRGATAAAIVAHAVFFPIGVVGMTGAKAVGDVSISWSAGRYSRSTVGSGSRW